MTTFNDILLHIRGILLITPWALALIVQDLLLSSLLLVKPLAPGLAYRLSWPIVWSCWAWIQYIFVGFNGAKIKVSQDSDPLPVGESAIVIANHVGWSDFYMIQALAMKAQMLGGARYFAKAQLKMVPLLGWGLWAAGMPLVTRNWQHDKREMDHVFEGIVKTKWNTWLISFSEATRYTPGKYIESQKWCAANGRPQPQHLLYPRTKGFIATVQHLRSRAPHVRAVYDFTIAYQRGRCFQAAPPFWDTLRCPRLSAPRNEGGRDYHFEVRAKRIPMEDLPLSDEDLAKWLEQRWVEKGRWLEHKRQQWGS